MATRSDALDPMEPVSIGTPATIDVELECPTCRDRTSIEVTMQTRVVKDQDGKGNAMSLRVRSAKVAHSCGQGRLGLAEGSRER
jgi:hypothetical protein